MPTGYYEFVVETYHSSTRGESEKAGTMPFFTLEEAIAYSKDCSKPWRIVLRRDSTNPLDGFKARYFAVPDAQGHLPTLMESEPGLQDGPPVPERFASLVIPVYQPM